MADSELNISGISVSKDVICAIVERAAEGDEECNSSRGEKHGGDSCGRANYFARIV